MNLRPCTSGNEVARALKDGHWPDGCTQELRSHVASCRQCTDLILITQVFQRARSESVHQPLAMPAQLLWWRAQLRRRNAVTRRVNRPITIAEIFAFVTILLVAVMLVGSQYNHGLRWASWLISMEPSRILHPFWMGFSNLNFLSLLPGLGLVAVASGIVLYLALERS